MLNLGRAYYEEGDNSKAVPIWRDLGQWCVEHPGGNLFQGLTEQAVLPKVISCYEALQQSDKAAPWEQRLCDSLRTDIVTKTLQVQAAEDAGPGRANAGSLLRSREQLYRRLGDFPNALSDCTQLLALSPGDSPLPCRTAFLQKYLGDERAYGISCTEILRRFEHTTNRALGNRIATACLLGLGPVDELPTVLRLADQAVAPGPPPPPSYQMCKGICEYRRGNFDSAAEWLLRASDEFAKVQSAASRSSRDTHTYAEGRATACFFLALAQHRRGEEPAARLALQSARRQLRAEVPGVHSGLQKVGLEDWLAAQIAAREADSTFGPDAPAIGPAAVPGER
jgi:tetratricopeptide (TPR) repeat protein